MIVPDVKAADCSQSYQNQRGTVSSFLLDVCLNQEEWWMVTLRVTWMFRGLICTVCAVLCSLHPELICFFVLFLHLKHSEFCAVMNIAPWHVINRNVHRIDFQILTVHDIIQICVGSCHQVKFIISHHSNFSSSSGTSTGSEPEESVSKSNS